MTADQTANLSDAVLNQPNGIVLVWSHYSSNTVHNYQFNFDFIPKSFVSLHPGAGTTCIMAGVPFTPVASKYVYIHDNKIVGYKDNTATGTKNGITYANNQYVLRYVISV